MKTLARRIKSPRQTKRLINQYMLVRALVPPPEKADFITLHAVPATLLALLTGWASEGEALCSFLRSPRCKEDSWKSMLERLTPRERDGIMGNEIDRSMTHEQARRWEKLIERLHHYDLDMTTCRRALDRWCVGRFAYRGHMH